MTKAYYIETKSYWKDSHGTDLQVADGGDLPIIYRTLKRALERVERMIKLYTETMGYTVIIPNDNYPGVGSQYHYACRLQKENPQIRLEIRIYTIYFNE
jgi:hypothetical protein